MQNIFDVSLLADLNDGGMVSFAAPNASMLEMQVNEYLNFQRADLATPTQYAVKDFKLAGAGDGGMFWCTLQLIDTGAAVLPDTEGNLPLIDTSPTPGIAFVRIAGGPDPGLAHGSGSPGVNETWRAKMQALVDDPVTDSEIYFADTAGCGRGRKFIVGAALLATPVA